MPYSNPKLVVNSIYELRLVFMTKKSCKLMEKRDETAGKFIILHPNLSTKV